MECSYDTPALQLDSFPKGVFFLGVVCELRAAIDAELLIEWSRRTETDHSPCSRQGFSLFSRRCGEGLDRELSHP